MSKADPCSAPAHVCFGSKADICSAKRHVRFTPNRDRESGLPQQVMSALLPKANICGAPAQVRPPTLIVENKSSHSPAWCADTVDQSSDFFRMTSRTAHQNCRDRKKFCALGAGRCDAKGKKTFDTPGCTAKFVTFRLRSAMYWPPALAHGNVRSSRAKPARLAALFALFHERTSHLVFHFSPTKHRSRGRTGLIADHADRTQHQSTGARKGFRGCPCWPTRRA